VPDTRMNLYSWYAVFGLMDVRFFAPGWNQNRAWRVSRYKHDINKLRRRQIPTCQKAGGGPWLRPSPT
jgi:hypothetical protein